MPFYKIFGIAFPEMLISIYSISILISLVIGLEKGGIRGIRSFLGWVHFYTLDAPIGGFVKWITEQDKSFIVLFSAILIFVFTSSLSYYLRDSLSRISSLNKQKIASVSNSSYMLIFSVFASIDYANLINHEVGFILTCFLSRLVSFGSVSTASLIGLNLQTLGLSGMMLGKNGTKM